VSHIEGGTEAEVFENRVLRKLFGPKRDEVTEGWRRLHNGKLYDVNFSPNIIRVFKSRRMRWAGYVACMKVVGRFFIGSFSRKININLAICIYKLFNNLIKYMRLRHI
jgi:hypothetical protein